MNFKPKIHLLPTSPSSLPGFRTPLVTILTFLKSKLDRTIPHLKDKALFHQKQTIKESPFVASYLSDLLL